MVELLQKTGLLVLILQPEEEKVRLFLRKGRILSAKYDNHESPRNTALIYKLLARGTGGKFDFRPQSISAPDGINTLTSKLLIDGARLLDDESRQFSRTQPRNV